MSKGKTKFIRKVKSDNFTIMDNKFLKRSDMTAKSKGLLAYLLTLPDDWVVYKDEIFRNHKEGYYALDTAFKELKQLGYINHFSVRNKKGQIERWECEIYEEPKDNHSYQSKQKKNENNPDENNPDENNPDEDNSGVNERIVDNQELQSTNSTKDLFYKGLNELIDDDDINKELEKIITPKIIKKLKVAGIQNLSETKLLPIARSMSKLMVFQDQTLEKAEELILFAIDVYELNSGRSFQYIITILTDWYENDFHTVESVRKYINDYRNGRTESTNDNVEPVPMVNWIKNLGG